MGIGSWMGVGGGEYLCSVLSFNFGRSSSCFWDNRVISSLGFSIIYDEKVQVKWVVWTKIGLKLGQSLNFSLSSLPSMSMEDNDDCRKYKNEDQYMVMIMMTMTLHRVMTGIIGGGFDLCGPRFIWHVGTPPSFTAGVQGCAMCTSFHGAKMFCILFPEKNKCIVCENYCRCAGVCNVH